MYSEKNKLGNKRTILDRLAAIKAAQPMEGNYSEEVWLKLNTAMEQAVASLKNMTLSKLEAENVLTGLSKAHDGLVVEDAIKLIALDVTGSIEQDRIRGPTIAAVMKAVTKTGTRMITLQGTGITNRLSSSRMLKATGQRNKLSAQ